MRKFQFKNSIDDDNFPFSLGKAVLQDEGFELHTHDYCELVIIISGRGLHTADKKTYPVGTGDIFVINRNQSHSFSRSNNLTMYNIGYREKIKEMEELYNLPGIKVLFELEPKSRINTDFKSRFHATPDQLRKIKIT